MIELSNYRDRLVQCLGKQIVNAIVEETCRLKKVQTEEHRDMSIDYDEVELN